MNSELCEVAKRFAGQRGLVIGPALGAGIHGIVLRARFQHKPAEVAIKVHSDAVPFHREVAAYERLAVHEVVDILGFNVPQLLALDRRLRIIEMSIVARPFVLDFAAAYLDRAPVFDPDVLVQWEEDKREQFGERWPTVLTILAALRDLGIHQSDVSPGNIGF